LLADSSRTSANIARGLLFAGMFGMFFFLTQYLQEVLHFSSLKTGFAFLPMPTTVFAVSQLTTRTLSERIPGRVLMLGGVALAATGFLLAAGLGEHSSYLHVSGCVILFAIGNGLSFVPLTSAALAGVPPRDAGAASGLVNVTQQLGGALGVAVLVTVAGSASKHAGGTAAHAFVVGATHAFAGSAVFLIAAFVLVAALVRPAAAAH
jgi:predicted MFS family arabinose efflux permease